MKERHGSWRMFDVMPMFITVGNASGESRRVQVDHLAERERMALDRLRRPEGTVEVLVRAAAGAR